MAKLPSGIPDLDQAAKAFRDFVVTIAALRDPKDGCPWDLKQTHETLRRYMIEEAYEASEAMASDDAVEIQGELGDVLLQVVLNAQLAKDDERFSIVEVIKGIDDKMRRRHPHVFGPKGEASADEGISVAEVRSNWDVIKAEEKAKAGKTKAKGAFADAEKKQPASLQAEKIGKIAEKIRFDWDSPDEVFAQVRSEVDEVAAELAKKKRSKAKLAEEIGDLYFSLTQLCRHLELDPEIVAVDANRKFLRRFARLEEIAGKRKLPLAKAKREELEALWKAVKREEE